MQACNDWLRMGPGRTIPRLLELYKKSGENVAPTLSMGTLINWSSHYDWPSRAPLYDAHLEEEKNRRAKEIMASGLALAYERVATLQKLADTLEQEIYERGETGVLHNIWLPDVKQVGSGEYAERVDLERFNGSILEQFRGVLDDIAREVGGRKQRSEISGPEGKPIPIDASVAGLNDVELIQLIRNLAAASGALCAGAARTASPGSAPAGTTGDGSAQLDVPASSPTGS